MTKRLLTFSLLALTALLATGCAGRADEAFVPGAYSAGAEQVSEIVIDVRDRRVEILPSDDGMVHLEYFESTTEGYDISLTDGVLTMTYAPDKSWTDYFGVKPDSSVRIITLRVPADVHTLSVATTNADLCFGQVSVAGNLSAGSNGGSVTFERLEAAGDVTLRSKNGDVRGTLAGSFEDYAIACDVKKGESSLPAQTAGGAQALSVTVNNGDADVRFEGRQP